MHSKALLTAALVAALAMPAATVAMAKTKSAAKTYFAEQSLKSKFCYAVAFKPNPKFATTIGTGSFAKLSLALAAIKADTDCKAPHMAKAKMASAKIVTAKVIKAKLVKAKVVSKAKTKTY